MRLQEIVRSGTIDQCFSFLQTLDPKRRRQIATWAMSIYREADEARYNERTQGPAPAPENAWQQQREIAQVAVLASATEGELKKLGLRLLPLDAALLERLVLTFAPAWLDGWLIHLLEQRGSGFGLVRHLYEAGLCAKPRTEAYTTAMIGSVVRGLWRYSSSDPYAVTTAQLLLERPDILAEDIWQLFRVEGGGEDSLAAVDKYTRHQDTWCETLVSLSADGHVDRQRLLDESLAALARDFAQFRAGWFSRFHEALQPNIDERIARRQQYLQLLSSQVAPTVSFSLKALVLIDKAGALPGEALVDHIAPALQARAKASVKTALRLLRNASESDAGLRARIALLSTGALIHTAADVQAAVLALVGATADSGDRELADEILLYRDGIAPSVKANYDVLCEKLAGDGAVQDTHGHVPPPGHPLQPIPAISHDIAGVDETTLIALWAQCLEDASDPMRMELLIDGLSRCGAGLMADGGSNLAPLAKRARALMEQEIHDVMRWQAILMAAALTGRMRMPESTLDSGVWYRSPDVSDRVMHPDIPGVFRARAATMLLRVYAGISLPVLSTPTDRSGFLRPQILLSRYREYLSAGHDMDTTDAALALMRLDVTEADVESLGLDAADPLHAAIAIACTGELPAALPATMPEALMIAATACRMPDADPAPLAKRLGCALPGAGAAPEYSLRFTDLQGYSQLLLATAPALTLPVPDDWIAPIFFATTAGGALGSACGASVSALRWSATVWPRYMEAYFAAGIAGINTYDRIVNNPDRVPFEAFLTLREPVTAVGAALLLHGGGVNDPAVRVAATAGLEVVIARGLLSDACLGEAFAAFLPSGVAPVNRWITMLSTTAAASPLHAETVRSAIEQAMPAVSQPPPRGTNNLLELWYELQLQSGCPVTNPSVVEWLKRLAGGGKIAKYRRLLLALKP